MSEHVETINDAGAIYVVNTLLDCKTQGEAEAKLEELGASYAQFANRLLSRLTFPRTKNQNALLHKWFGQIAEYHGDRSAKDVKGQCHHEWALEIRLRDPKFAWVWERTGALLEYEKQCALLASETLGISSRMATKELKEYMDLIEARYRPLGVQLAHPKDKK